MRPERAYDVVISFAGEDGEHAEALAIALKRRGVVVFHHKLEKDRGLGEELYAKLVDIYQNRGKYCVILVSKNYLNQWTKVELHAAQARKFENPDEDYILPVRLDDTNIPGILSTTGYLEWPPENEETIAETIVRKLDNLTPGEFSAVVEDAKAPAYYLNYTPFLYVLAFITVLLVPIVQLPQTVVKVLAALLIASAIWILYLALASHRAFGTTTPVPAPSALWRIIFNQLAPQKGKKHKGAGLEILVIVDSSTEETFNKIRKHYTPDIVEIKKFKHSSDFERTELESQLNKSDAVYFFCTQNTHRDREPYDTVNDWGIANSHKPVLAVNFLPPEAPYHWTFNLIPQTEAVQGVWKLLARSTERASQLRGQANTFRRIWAVTICIALFLFGLWGWSLEEASRKAREAGRKESEIQNKFDEHKSDDEKIYQMLPGELEHLETFRNSPEMHSLRDTIQSLLNTKLPMKEGTQSPADRTQEALSSFAKYLVEDLRKRGMVNDTGSISFWRKYEDQETRKPYFVKVARSGGAEDCFPGVVEQKGGEYAIVACAVEATSFVRWRANLNVGESASWSRQGVVNGYWIEHEGKRSVQMDSGLQCGYQKGENERKAVMCVGVGDGSLKSGICLSTNQDSFRQEEWTKNYLYHAVSIMQIIPDSLLITDKKLTMCRNKK